MKWLITDWWDRYLDLYDAGSKDIYFTEAYVKLYESHADIAECFVGIDGEKAFILPYLRRKVDILNGDYYDIETPYGYGGPLVNCDDPQFAVGAFDLFCEAARERRIIAGFIRFNPLLENHRYVGRACQTVFDRKTVAMDLTLALDDIWLKEIHPKHRNTIRIAEKSGLAFEADTKLDNLESFMEIYNSTMVGLGVEDFFFFDSDYYDAIKRNFKGRSFLGIVRVDDEIVAAALFLYSGRYAHYHLSGSLKSSRKYGANNFLVYRSACWLKEQGVEVLHLGGGTSGAADDSLYKFKRRFSKTEYDFYIGKLLLDPARYAEACRLWEETGGSKEQSPVFLKYRYPSSGIIVGA